MIAGEIGVVTGRQIFINREGVQLRTLLQVQFSEGDIRTVELFTACGEDTNPPDGARVIVIDITDSYAVAIAISDDIMPEVGPGEKEFYSIDGTGFLKMGRLKLWSTGDVTITSTNGVLEQAKITSGVDGSLLLESVLGGGTVEIDALGNVIHNAGINSAVSYAALDLALQGLIIAINAALATKLDGAGGPGALTLDISASESNTVLIP